MIKKITLMLLFCASTFIYGQTISNFEPGDPGVDATGGGIVASVETNPVMSGLNTSANSLRVSRSSAANWWALVNVDVTPDIAIAAAPTDTKYISMLLNYPAQPDIAIRVSAAAGNNGNNTMITRALNSYDASAANTWQQIVFEVKTDGDGVHSFTTGTLFKVVIHPDMGFNNIPAGQVLDATTFGYIDNIQVLDTNPLANDWLGVTSVDWNTASNWSKNAVPSVTDLVTIPTGTTFAPSINATTGVKVQNLTINAGATVTVEDGGSLIITGVSSGATGSIKYTRTLTADADPAKAWHLATSPVAGVTIVDFIANNTLANGTTNPTFRGIANYTNDGNGFNYYDVSYAGTDAFNVAKGFAIKNAAAGTVEFSGFFRKADREITISQGTDNFNLVGNAFLAYMNLGTFFTDNNAVDRLSEATIWLWDPSANAGNGGYITKMSGTDAAFEIAPGQSFFVSAGPAASNVVSFSEANQSHQTDTFLKSTSNRTEIQLNVQQGDLINNTSLYYIEGTTTGFDNGFDGSLFTGIESDLSIYTELVADVNGSKIAVQSLPNSDYDNMIVPIGLKAEAGKEIIISAELLNLPEGINVFLEDRLNNTMTNLNDGDFTINLNENVNGSGRFFLRTSANVLSTKNIELTDVSIFKLGNGTLRVTGLENANGVISVFNITGKQMMAQKFEANSTLNIKLPNLATGVYIVRLNTNNGTVNKKIILE